MNVVTKSVMRANVGQVVESHLREHGYDGLCAHDCPDGCGCFLGDLFPCGSECLVYCIPGYAQPDEGGERIIGPSKPRPGDLR